MDYRGWRLDPRKRSSSLPAAAVPSKRPPFQQCPFPSPCLCLSSQPSNGPGLSGRERGWIFLELGLVLLGPKTGPVTSRESSPASPVLWPQTPDSTLQSLARSSDPFNHLPLPPGILFPKPPSASGFPAFSGCTFCELKDWVQWYRTRLSLGQWAGLAAWGASGASAGLAASLSSAEMGHQLQLVGVRLLGVAMTAQNQRKERRRLRQRRLSLAQHHMASPSLPLSFSPSLPSP